MCRLSRPTEKKILAAAGDLAKHHSHTEFKEVRAIDPRFPVGEDLEIKLVREGYVKIGALYALPA